MSAAPVTEAHIARARASGFSTDKGLQMAAQFIANNEAAKEERDQLRAERDSIKQEIEMVEHRAYRAEAKISNQAERIRYLEGATNHATGTPLSLAIARAERAEREAFDWKKIARYETARAARAEAELATERARLDYLSTRGFEHRNHETGDHLGYEWTISSRSESEDVTLRDVIDAEMREEAK